MLASKMNSVLRTVSKGKLFLNNRTISSTILNRSSSEPLAAPEFEGTPKVYSEKVKTLVDQISRLNLLEVSDLNDLLRKTLNIKDVPMGGGFVAAAPAAAAPVEEEEAQVVPTKSSFRLKLVGFNADKKVALIKEIKALGDGMNLVQAKKFVESAPQVLRDNIGKDECEKLKEQLEKVGATVEIE